MSGGSVAVRCAGIRMAFGAGNSRVDVLRGIDVAFRDGELSLLMGPSGCGKTTLISIIAALLTPTAGMVSVFGQRLEGMTRQERVRFRLHDVGFVFQQYQLLRHLTAVENVAVPLLARGMPARRARWAAEAMLERVGLSSVAQLRPASLSGGQQQRVAIARALVHEPRLLVCDEPTAALDAAAGRLVVELLREVAVRPGRACITVTHDHRIVDLADTVIGMEDGRVVEITDGASGDWPVPVAHAPEHRFVGATAGGETASRLGRGR